MKHFFKQNIAIVLAFSLPLVLIVVVALSVYLPSTLLSTHYNFVYAACVDDTNYYSYTCDTYLQQRYSVIAGRVVVNEIDPADVTRKYEARLFFHDTANNETREISIAEAQSLQLDELITSPDGVSVVGQYDRGTDVLLLFNSGSSYERYLVKGSARTRLNLINKDNRYYYRDNFKFIGWVLPGRN